MKNGSRTGQPIFNPAVDIPPQIRLLTREQTAEYMGVSISTIDNWTRAGLIERVKIGRAVRYTPESIENFIYQNNKKRICI